MTWPISSGLLRIIRLIISILWLIRLRAWCLRLSLCCLLWLLGRSYLCCRCWFLLIFGLYRLSISSSSWLWVISWCFDTSIRCSLCSLVSVFINGCDCSFSVFLKSSWKFRLRNSILPLYDKAKWDRFKAANSVRSDKDFSIFDIIFQIIQFKIILNQINY